MTEHLPEKIKTVLVNNGVDIDGGSFHSWRCFDKERYPEPCTCTDEVVAEIMAVVDDELRACEQRVRAYLQDSTVEPGGYAEGYAAGVQAARDAVAALQHKPGAHAEHFLTAIDNLMEK